MTRAALQLAAWSAAFWLALWLHGRHAQSGRARFALALGCGALLARAGDSLLWGDPARVLDPEAGVSVLFFPLGALCLAPGAAALACLPLPLALARIGCLAAGCCRGASGELLPLFDAAGLVLLHAILARANPEAVPERFAWGFGALRIAQEPWRPHTDLAGAVPTPWLVAIAWIGLGVLMRWARRPRFSVTKRRRLFHASGTPQRVP